MLDVGGGQHLGLVDVVDLECLQDLRLGEVADPALRHHRDRDGLLDLADHARVGHPRHPAVTADVGRNALERHHGAGAGVLGDHGLLGVDDVHDDAALEHLGEAALDAHRPGLAPEAVLGHGDCSVARCVPAPHVREQARRSAPSGRRRRRRRRRSVCSATASAAGAAGAGGSQPAAGTVRRRRSRCFGAAGSVHGTSRPCRSRPSRLRRRCRRQSSSTRPSRPATRPAASCSRRRRRRRRIASSSPSHAQKVRNSLLTRNLRTVKTQQQDRQRRRHHRRGEADLDLHVREAEPLPHDDRDREQAGEHAPAVPHVDADGADDEDRPTAS